MRARTYKKLFEVPGLSKAYERMICRWLFLKYPQNVSTLDSKIITFKRSIAIIFTFIIEPGYRRFISFITRYYPFSLLYRNRLYHADNLKVRNLMDSLEKLAERARIPVYINNGERNYPLSIFYGSFETKTPIGNREEVIDKLRTIYQEKYGTIFVRESEAFEFGQKWDFEVLVPQELI